MEINDKQDIVGHWQYHSLEEYILRIFRYYLKSVIRKNRHYLNDSVSLVLSSKLAPSKKLFSIRL